MLAWFSDLNRRERHTMIACFGGWSLDAMDVMVFSFVIPSLLTLCTSRRPRPGYWPQ